MSESIWIDGMVGLAIGDALGVPVEFTSRVERKADPVTGMRAYGTHNQPAGTWSDDSSMAFATVDSILGKSDLDYKDIMEKFSGWCLYGDYTPFQNNFDIGITTSRALMNYGRGTAPVLCGGATEQENGNGSLMRILPVCLWLYQKQKKFRITDEEVVAVINDMSALTHRHVRSMIGCVIYFFLVRSLLDSEESIIDRLQSGMDAAFNYYRECRENFYPEVEHYDRLADLWEFKAVPEEEISSSGYVVHTLEAAVWCLINSSSYEEAVLKAVNLGDDTDTVGAVTGGLAGLAYGLEGIPNEWIEELQRREWIFEMLSKL